MKGTILITDSLFISPQNEERIRSAGYKIERLDKPKPTEEELVEAIKGKVGYVLGGIEHVTDKVIEAADALKVIAFTGTGYKDFIPAWELAKERGITITTSPDGHTDAVAEWAIGMAIAMNRGFFELGRAGEKVFDTTKGIEDQRIGLIGFGKTAQRIAAMIAVFKPASVSYFSQHQHSEIESSLKASFKSKKEIFSESDIVFVCVSRDAGNDFVGAEDLAVMKDGALVVSFMAPGIINEEALLSELKTGRIRAVSDYPPKDPAFKELPLSSWYSMNGSNAYNTQSGIKLTSDTTTESLLNILELGEDEYQVL